VRLLRLRLRNWRGVEQQEIEFAPCGVTVISGPNEAGKSSLIEALDMLFDRLDSSSKADLKAVKPVHKDEGPEVEAVVEAGRWRFRYRKRFHKRPLTELEVAAPRPESRTGRDAHQRVLEILEEALDLPLWKALRIAQDAGRGRAELSAGSEGSIGPEE